MATTSVSDPRSLLVSMPFGALERPAFGISLLKAGAREAGFDCDLRYLTFPFAQFIGVERYQWFVTGAPYTAFAGDWAFAAAANPTVRLDDVAYVRDVLRGTWRFDDEQVDHVLHARQWVEPFLDHCMDAVDWASYDLVGFTSTFEQNLASLALAHRIRAAHPDVIIAFGGANWEGPMGVALHRAYGVVDLAFSGEADESFPAVLRALAEGGDPAAVPGVVARREGCSVTTGPAAIVDDLDALPLPDFDDYFDAKERCAVADVITPSLLMETARGCWWGARHHCTFCGLNGGTMAYRSKRPDRAVAELDHLVERYGVDHVNMVDNILDMRYFRSVLPALAERDERVRLFYETKANLSHAQVRALAQAGVAEIQPGIEAMSDHVLELMRKGTVAVRNVQLLKWCREFGVGADWNLLYGFPDETADDYAETLDVLRSIPHLQSPTAVGPIRLDRFSPFHEDAAGFGMERVRPLDAYRHLYPVAPDTLNDIACYFDFDYADGRRADEFAGAVIAHCREIPSRAIGGGLWEVDRGTAADDPLVIVDDRGGSRATIALDGWQACAYRACDRAQTIADVHAAVTEVASDVDVVEVEGFMEWLRQRRLIIRRADHVVALAVHRPPRWEPTIASPRLHRSLAVSSA